MKLRWEDVGFDWINYQPHVRPAIALARERARRLVRCSLCGKRRISFGVLVHPALRRLNPPRTLRPRPYAVCASHAALSVDELGDALYGPAWRAEV